MIRVYFDIFLSILIHIFLHKKTRNAASARQSNNSSSSNHLQSVQGGMSEDEALAHALARSIQELDEAHDRNRRNQQQQQQSVPCGVNSGAKDKCLLS